MTSAYGRTGRDDAEEYTADSRHMGIMRRIDRYGRPGRMQECGDTGVDTAGYPDVLAETSER